MCRLLACLADNPTTLSRYTLEPPHSLKVQAYAPKEMLSGVVNADGFGAGWYTDDDHEPALYRSLYPIWSDTTFHSIASNIRSRSYFAALRNATPPLPSELAAVPPFSSGRYLFMHNGAIDEFRRSVMRPMRDSLSDLRYREVVGASDSETVFALILDRLDAGMPLENALLDTIRYIESICRDYDTKATLNLGLTDGEEMIFTRYSTRGETNSLYFLQGSGSVMVASERLDADERWRPVPANSVVTVGRGGTVSVEEIHL